MSNVTMEVENKNIFDSVVHACMPKISLKAGLNIFGEKGE